MDLACDESGSEGERLVGGVTDVFTHAGVRMTTESAADCVRELRRRIRSPATEYKANHLLREKHRPVLEWLLSPAGPIHGQAMVQLTDKEFFVVRKVADLLVEDVRYAATLGLHQGRPASVMAVTLHRDGPATFGRDRWAGFLESFNYLLRPRNRRGTQVTVAAFYETVDALRRAGTPGRAAEIIDLLWTARPEAESRLARLRDESQAVPVLNPIVPAIVGVVARWGVDGEPVSIVHDRQTSLTTECVARLCDLLDKPDPALPGHEPRGRLGSLTFVESHRDPRVQIADFLAGTARRIASDELGGRGDRELTALLRPYVDPDSIWGSDRSWYLGPGTSPPPAGPADRHRGGPASVGRPGSGPRVDGGVATPDG